MHFLYNLAILFAQFSLKIIAFFSPKMKLFVDGRKDVFTILKNKISPKDQTIWFHAASLGEYEQGLPVIEKIKVTYPTHKIIVTFFSPSGYEVRKNNTVADITVYLPLDTPKNAKLFLKLVHPDLAFFIKYEFWINYLDQLHKQNIPTYLISGIFRKKQLFFKWYGRFYRKALDTFTYFFVQNENSRKLIIELGKTNVSVSGDTRFDRVATILEKDNTLDFIAQFKDNKTTIVIGSSWPKDEALLVEYINSCALDVKFIIAPHNIKPEQIQQLQSSINKQIVLFSEKENKDLSQYEVFIIDTIGLLTKIYSYADIAYVGGGFGNPGVHNLLEPATFGIPIIIGPNYTHFDEAINLVNIEGCLSINNTTELQQAFSKLIQDPDIRQKTGEICYSFVQKNKGATNNILAQITHKRD
ncbi:3-deoxy-D-manno-octulosonic acid transferase [Flavobacterium taihuense]|uniref:3-deoxy-D-manno-octulosonic acid transferase n=1 Tax=Flavobacterium taihuense TaxID=2857508 RepID=A0ABS6XTG9_9FLAO|nr:glycosyltransferase N-terminal domain-containing protein [Flavobacterium taihuense]MBW4359647.1 3-deoxy-D-manno-octulosonic acid transferase [Flavobacterium taihuense]